MEEELQLLMLRAFDRKGKDKREGFAFALLLFNWAIYVWRAYESIKIQQEKKKSVIVLFPS